MHALRPLLLSLLAGSIAGQRDVPETYEDWGCDGDCGGGSGTTGI
eukprot:SAG25_NODE_6975_length_514_cov_1.363855_1_plen_44_part_10